MPLLSWAAHPLTEEAGRLGTRSRRGHPAKRWEEAVPEARSYAANEGVTGLLRSATRRKKKQRFMVKEVTSLSPAEIQGFDDVSDFRM